VEKYEALSYTWGQPGFNHQIICDDKQLPITQNLFEALRQLRKGGERVLWIDAICINQSDDDEKSAQIPYMRNIYKLADRVVIWLGTADADAIAAFEWIDRAAGSVVKKSEEELNRARGFPPFKGAGSEKWEPVLKFFSRAWFGRVWVVQECAMAKEAVV
ncbi:heterokaryon incompatibility, partial [Hyaloscypha variabilis F]